MRIRFGDHFSVSVPGLKRITDLKRDEAVYLPSGMFADELYNYINNKNCVAIPKEVLDDILVIEFQKYDAMIDVFGNELDWSMDGDEFAPREATIYTLHYGNALVDSVEWWDKKFSSVNNVFFNDKIDIEASIICNLLEIRPKTSLVSVDYLRYYFWRRPYCSASHRDCAKCEHDTGSFCNLAPLGTRALDSVGAISHRCISDACGAERFLLKPAAFTDMEIEIDEPDEQSRLVDLYNRYLDEQGRSIGKKELQILFGSPLYEDLKELEARVYSVLSPDEKKEPSSRERYIGFLRFLEEALTIFSGIKSQAYDGASNVSQATIMAFKTACEVVLNAKLRVLNLPCWSKKYTFYENISFLQRHKRDTFVRWLSKEEMDDFFKSLHYVRRMKNMGSHTTGFVTVTEASQIIDIACNHAIRGVIEFIK